MSNLIYAVFGNGRSTVTAPLLQWDQGQVLRIVGPELPACYEVHFGRELDGDSQLRLGDVNGVSIPDTFLKEDGELFAWVYLRTGLSDAETEYTITIPIKARAQPPDYEETEEERSAVAEAIAALNAETGRAAEAAEEAERQAEASGEKADDAAAAATLAESWAIGGTGTRLGEDFDNAKHYARLAQQGAAKSGYVFFHLDPETGEMIATVTDKLAEDVRFACNEETGELEVIFK